MKFETFTQGARTVYPVFLAGFHDSRFLNGEVFLSEEEAHTYCEDKVIYVKAVPFFSEEKAIEFVNTQAHSWINHIKSFDMNPANFLHQIECAQFKKEVETLLNE
jgi:hypothetical protein